MEEGRHQQLIGLPPLHTLVLKNYHQSSPHTHPIITSDYSFILLPLHHLFILRFLSRLGFS